MSTPENPQYERLSLSELGERAHELIDLLDDKLNQIPEFIDNKNYPVGKRLVDREEGFGFDYKETVLEFGKHWSSFFTEIPYHYRVSVKDKFSWEAPIPFMSGIPFPKLSPIRRRLVRRYDRTDPEHPVLTVVRLKSQFRRTLNEQLETGSIVRFKRGSIQIADQDGVRRNSREALEKVRRFIQEI